VLYLDDDNNERIPIESIRKEDLHKDSMLIIKYKYHSDTISFIQKKFNGKINKKVAHGIIDKLLNNDTSIKFEMSDSFKKLYYYKLNEDNSLKLEIIQELKSELISFINNIGQKLKVVEKVKQLEDKEQQIEEEYGIKYKLHKNLLYERFREEICDELGDISFEYDFNKPDMEVTSPINVNTLQRCKIQIMANNISVDYPIEYFYRCTECGEEQSRKMVEVLCTETKIKCEGEVEAGDKVKRCKQELRPDKERSTTKDCYCFTIAINDESGVTTHNANSFIKYKPGFYECVLFKIKNPKGQGSYFIVDVKNIPGNPFLLPDQSDNEHYCLTLIKNCDIFIKHQTGQEIFGLLPIKVALVLQMVAWWLKFPLVFNIQVVGDAGTGKSLVLKKYGFLLNNHLHCSSNAQSISIPGLRGSMRAFTLLGKEQKIKVIGYLGSYNTVHIDEVASHVELMSDMKSFLSDANYSYDKAGSEGDIQIRTAHVNISQNINVVHMKKYTTSVKNFYINDKMIEVGKDNIPPAWDDTWDLQLPLYKYNDNLKLRAAVKKTRDEYESINKFWIDDFEDALHQRFPFYFFICQKDKHDEQIDRVLKENVTQDIIDESYELLNKLKNNELPVFFQSLKKYKHCEDHEHEIKSFGRVDEIRERYNLGGSSREKIFYYNLLMLSRIINRRQTYEETDFDFIKWMIENMNCKVDVKEMNDYKVNGYIDFDKENKIDKLIESSRVYTPDKNTQFGLQGEEFE